MNAPARISPAAQRRASDPHASVWVSANAGSGKTHILIERVIRLMLAGTEPSRILCITFTKAAASEMNRRLFGRLGGWAALADSELDRKLSELGVDSPTPEIRDRACKLFTLALETPGGLKIQTIHAFAERLLQLFPVEAGVIPGFEIMDERTAAELVKAARHAALAEAEAAPQSDFGTALQTVVGLVQADRFDRLMDDILKRRSELGPVLADRQSIARAADALRNIFGLGAAETTDTVTARLTAIDHALYGELIDVLETQSAAKTDRASAEALRTILGSGQAIEPLLREFFLTQDNKCRKPQGLMTERLRAAAPLAADKLDAEQQRVFDHCGKVSALEMIAATESLLTLASRIAAKYEEAKRQRGCYDFDDLIHRTRALLRERPSAAWVLYKLDGGIDHILVDEAQDTSPPQWEIVTALAEDFFSGLGARPDTARTIFVVGDRKQSIFSFQGADPDAFDRARGHFASRIFEPERLREIPLTVSHRSTEDVLSAVDAVFADETARRGLNASVIEDFTHSTVRIGEAGLVEFWPAVCRQEKEEREPWTVPVDRIPRNHPSVMLARDIARKIRSWLGGERVIESRRRPVREGDILILVRTRNRFFDAIIRELHHLGVAVAGADRVKLGEHIAVQDLVALGRFALLREDDYSLACVLKSPLVAHPAGRNFDDGDLFAIAHARGSKSLWRRLCEDPSLDAIRATLERWSLLAHTAAPFEFFSAILAEGRPSIRQRILGRLGSEASDIVDAFLDLVLEYESTHGSALQGFLTWFAAADTEIKRDMEQGTGEVRVMTVHGAKGLEANIVILPDTCAVPDGRTEARLLIASDEAGNAVPLWRLSGRVEPEALTRWRAEERVRVMEEYRRQLYVAMTRARDELYICGYSLSEAPNGECWYELVRRGLAAHNRAVTDGDGVIRVRGSGTKLAADIQAGEGGIAPATPPDWALVPAPPVQSPSRRHASPSRIVRPAMTARAANRGRAIHRLFHLLPDLPQGDRPTAARRLLTRRGFSPEEAAGIAGSVLALIGDPRLAGFFAPSSLAEVPFAARFGAPILGQIDRLVVTEREAFILDFKTDRRPPAVISGVSPAYVAQLAAYRAGLMQVFPGKQVRAALLWTETPALMELPAALMDDAFSAYLSIAGRP